MADEKEEKHSDAMMQVYRERLQILKRAQEFSQKNDIPKAVQSYSKYLNILCTYFRVTEDKLSPNLFDAEKDITEMLLISHAYWDLAKAYDRSPTLRAESARCLDQFVKFSTGHKFQHVNAQMLRKFCKSRKCYNPKAFNKAYERMHVNSKGCYLASYAFGENDDVTNYFREFKKSIIGTKFGFKFVEQYYIYSPKFVSFCVKHPKFGLALKHYFFKPILLCLKGLLEKNK